MREIRGAVQFLPAIMVETSYTEPDAGATVALLGDSITAGNSIERRNRGYWTWAEVLQGQLCDVVAYAGVGGNNCAQMLARVNADVIAVDPDVCVVMGGTNDIAGGRTYAQIIADLEDIYDLLHAAGIHIIATTSVPSTSYATETQKQYFRDLATWVEDYVDAHPSYMSFCDTGSLYADADEHPQAGYSWDGVHPTALGAYTIGSALATAIAGVAPARNHWLDAGDPRLINYNTTMVGTGGARSGLATGVVATGYQAAGNCVASKVARSGGGEWQKIAMNANGDGRISTPSIDVTAKFAAGETVVLEVEFETDDDWTNIQQFHVYLQFRDSGGSELIFRSSLFVDNYSGPLLTPAVYLPRPASGILRTEPTVVPSGCTAIRNYVYIKGAAGSMRIGRYQLRKIA
jgi:lysophospholipase L1-like esterase